MRTPRRAKGKMINDKGSLSHPSIIFTPLRFPRSRGQKDPKREGLTNLLGGGLLKQFKVVG